MAARLAVPILGPLDSGRRMVSRRQNFDDEPQEETGCPVEKTWWS